MADGSWRLLSPIQIRNVWQPEHSREVFEMATMTTNHAYVRVNSRAGISTGRTPVYRIYEHHIGENDAGLKHDVAKPSLETGDDCTAHK